MDVGIGEDVIVGDREDVGGCVSAGSDDGLGVVLEEVVVVLLLKMDFVVC